jgi:NAD(P)-dependent dehydrogenase (short-subunit alcohol dehydrogenase family)
LRELRKTRVAQVGPGALRGEVIVYGGAQVFFSGWRKKSLQLLLKRDSLCNRDCHFLQEPGLSQVVLITGGSRGIGAATALMAASRGYAVAVNYSANSLAADEVVRQIRQSGGQAMTVQADVAVEAQVVAMFEKVDARFGRLGALVNNAGVVDQTTRVDAITLARLQRMFEINVFGSFLCAREAVRRMSTRHGGAGGAIVNVSSAAARMGSPGQYVDYAAAKGAIDTFTIGLAKEVAAEGIRVNAVRPGIIDTDIHASGGLPHRARDVAPQVPMQRAGSAEEVAESILWLLGDASSYTTGALLDVTGGR